MKLSIACVILMTSAISPVLAGDLNLQTHVDAATVYPQGADVWRVGDVELPQGETRLVLSDLPGQIDPQSIRVEAEGEEGLLINGVDTKLVEQPSTAMDEKRKVLETKVQDLTDERQALDQVIADAQTQKNLLLSLANKQPVPTSTSEVLKPLDATSMDNIVTLVGSKLSVISKTIHDAQLRQRQIDREVGDINVATDALSPDSTDKLEVSINVNSKMAGSGHFKVKYRIEEAGWVPFYDAKLSLPVSDKPAHFELIRRAEVRQSTPENWDNVALKLSTARPNGASTAPELGEDPIDVFQARGDLSAGRSVALAKDGKLQEMAPAAPATDELKADKPKKEAVQAQAQVVVAGFNAEYLIEGRVNIDNSGQSKKLRISSADLDTKLEDVAVPRLDPTAYLMASFAVNGDEPMLPGQVNLYRDDIYVGQGSVGQLSPGEEAKLGFGADDLVKVKRVEIKRNSGEEGFFTTSFTKTFAWNIAVKNLHTTAFPVVIVDRIPFATRDEVKIEQVSDFTPATTENYQLKRGVKAWTLNLDPKAEKSIVVGYKVVAPKDVPLVLTD